MTVTASDASRRTLSATGVTILRAVHLATWLIGDVGMETPRFRERSSRS